MNTPRLKILIVGASGFIGHHLSHHLSEHDHEVIALGRSRNKMQNLAPFCRLRSVDPVSISTKAWGEYLQDVDAVVNCIGAFRNVPNASLLDVHEKLPERLVEACARSGCVRRFVQVSALGAAVDAPTPFLATKGVGDAAIAAKAKDLSWPHWTVVRASVVVGEGGGSTRLFTALASQPWELKLPDRMGRIQPIHIDDLSGLIAAALLRPETEGQILTAAGPDRLSMSAYYKHLRDWAGIGSGIKISVPMVAMRLGAWLGQFVPGSLLTPDALLMLATAEAADPAKTQALTGYTVRPLDRALWDKPLGAGGRLRVRLEMPMVALRWALALMWLATAFISLGVYPRADSFALLARTPLPEATHLAALVGASLLDGVFGVLLLLGIWLRGVLALQIATMVVFSAIIAMYLPEQFAHPFGPVLKNLPLIFATAVLWVWEDT